MVQRGVMMFGLVAALLLGGCASAGGPTDGVRYDRYRIEAAEIAQLQGQVSNLYDVVSRLRPRWLDGDIVVYHNQSLLGTKDYLSSLPPDYATSLRFLDRSQAVAQLPGIGARSVDGAIVLSRQ